MKAVVVRQNNPRGIEDVPKPVPGAGEVLVKVRYTGICGSDHFHLSGENPRAGYPLIAGHEISGEIARVGEHTDTWETGELVTVFPALSCGKCEACLSGNPQMHRPLRMIGVQEPGGFAEYCIVPEENLIRLPAGIDMKKAALAEPLAVAIHGIRLAKVELGDTALVIGAGPIGIMTALLLQMNGCRKVFISELSESRIAFAEMLGLNCINLKKEDAVEIISGETDGHGADCIFECVGHPSTIPQIIGAGALYSRAVIIGAFHGEGAMVDFFAMSTKEQTITVSWQYTKNDFKRAVEILGEVRFPGDKLITHVLPPEEITKGLAMMKNGEAMKVLIDFTESKQ